MRTVIVTDGKYRMSIAAVRTLGRAGWRVVVTQTEADSHGTPPSFLSKYAAQTHWIPGSSADASYADRLAELLSRYDRPVLLALGAKTLHAVSKRLDRFSNLCDFLIAPPETLDALNDKQQVQQRAAELGLPTPKTYRDAPDAYPVIVKPRCGEKFGLKAGDRYIVANDEASYLAAMEAVRKYDPNPIVQQKIEGQGIGVSMALGKSGELLGAFCHRRIREFPISGGPSSCCESFYDPDRIEKSYQLLKSFSFTGLAMVEWKGDSILEVNPRIWGSFPLTAQAQSPLIVRYAEAASGLEIAYTPCDYKLNVKARFTLSDAASGVSQLLRGHFREGIAAAADALRVPDALYDPDDPKPYRAYLRGSLRR